MPGTIIERVAERAVKIARERNVEMVGWAAVTKHVGILTIGRLPDSSPAAGADLIVEHSVVDVPVGDPAGTMATMPIATIVTARRTARVIGIALALDAPTAAGAARALSDALARCAPAAGAARRHPLCAQPRLR